MSEIGFFQLNSCNCKLQKLINLTLWPLLGASVSRVTHTHLRHSPMSPQACGPTA
jgi:hypothetical protein